MLQPKLSTIVETASLPLGVKPYEGFPSFALPYCYTPNQLLDLVLREVKDRGVVRLVFYVAFRQIRTSDHDGRSVEPQVLFSYSELEREAGIARGALADVIQKAIELKFIDCIREGQPARLGQAPVSALYRLRWDKTKHYAKTLHEFQGFYPYKGYRTWLPNDLFEILVPSEPLSVICTVAAILRETVGWEDEFGYRRLETQLSFSRIKSMMNLSMRAVAKGIKIALTKGYILQVRQGVFQSGTDYETAVYSPKWRDLNHYLFPQLRALLGNESAQPEHRKPNDLPNSGSKRAYDEPAERFKTCIRDSSPAVQNVHTNSSDQRFIPCTRSGSIGASESGSKRAYIENNTFKKDKNKQQQHAQRVPHVVVADDSITNLLREHGIHHRTATRLAKEYPEDLIRNQINWLKKREATRNPAGLLVKSIEEAWDAPPDEKLSTSKVGQSSLGETFAAYFYAGYHQNPGKPIAHPSANDVEAAGGLVEQLLAVWPDETKVADWGRKFGDEVRENHRFNEKAIPSFTVACRAYGDEFFHRHQARREEAQRRARQQAEEEHLQTYEPKWRAYLGQQERAFKKKRSKEYAEFEASRQQERAEIAEQRFQMNREERLARFDSEERRLEAFQEFFPDDVLDFWDWDEQMNPKRLNKKTVKLCE